MKPDESETFASVDIEVNWTGVEFCNEKISVVDELDAVIELVSTDGGKESPELVKIGLSGVNVTIKVDPDELS
ncbi:hypothetical protein BpHYR1_039800 [Brachionus plicatilis]|uniref:Uncharacterized protein n=1 Tax=Brachionus plicatilis TaxID=10195 RepID=A0A3M7Q559_BRAPC|nr:hypothetical protein BpHYR1_039800 [Brachionus plicatilis]